LKARLFLLGASFLVALAGFVVWAAVLGYLFLFIASLQWSVHHTFYDPNCGLPRCMAPPGPTDWWAPAAFILIPLALVLIAAFLGWVVSRKESANIPKIAGFKKRS